MKTNRVRRNGSAVAAAQQSQKSTQPEARREALAKVIAANAWGNAMQAFCAMIACGFDWQPEPGCELDAAESAQFLSARASVLSLLEARGADWFARARSHLAQEMPGYCNMTEPGGWKDIVDGFGLTYDEFISEAIVCALAQVSIDGQTEPLSAGGVA